MNTAVAGISGDFGGTFDFLPRGQLNLCRHRHHEETRTDCHQSVGFGDTRKVHTHYQGSTLRVLLNPKPRVLPLPSKRSILGVLSKAIYNRIILIVQLLLSGGSTQNPKS